VCCGLDLVQSSTQQSSIKFEASSSPPPSPTCGGVVVVLHQPLSLSSRISHHHTLAERGALERGEGGRRQFGGTTTSLIGGGGSVTHTADHSCWRWRMITTNDNPHRSVWVWITIHQRVRGGRGRHKANIIIEGPSSGWCVYVSTLSFSDMTCVMCVNPYIVASRYHLRY
jgi:hypothetical protein